MNCAQTRTRKTKLPLFFVLLSVFGAMYAGLSGFICPVNTCTAPTGSYAASPAIKGFDENGASHSKFSVSKTKQVSFSQGNLRYQASTKTWRFAEHQYDCVGDSNRYVSSTNKGWIDLFGWGTSGWDSGANGYQPWFTSNVAGDYYPGGESWISLVGIYAKADWGYNPIANGGGRPLLGSWRTLSSEEWLYLLVGRTDASNKYGVAIIDNQYTGLVILPDDWKLPSGLSFKFGCQSYSQNKYTLAQWSRMEAAGAVFLPAAGDRYGVGIGNVGRYGNYWSSSCFSKDYSCSMFFYGNSIYPGGWYSREVGLSVRLVKNN